MKTKSGRLTRLFLYIGLRREDYEDIKALIMERNLKTLGMTSVFCAALGLLFLAINLVMRTGAYFPYVFLTAGGAAVIVIRPFVKKNYLGGLFVCYLMIVTVFVYALILSCSPSNRQIPATSLIVFLALFPLAVDDKPIRMCSLVIAFSVLYLIISFRIKTPEVLRYDIMNTATFSVVGVLFYIVICTRNVREIYQSRLVERSQKDVISSLAAVIEERDESTGKHIVRTETYIRQLVERMKRDGRYRGLTDEYFKDVVRASPLHDIGKVKIPDGILNKPGRLTDEEFAIIRRHAEYGADIINKTMRNTEDHDYFEIARNIALYHHERYDGKGYPEGLSGERIPLEARIMALADVYDALVSERVYKKAYPKNEAERIIREGRGTQFDPVLTDLFLSSLGSAENAAAE